MEFFKDHDMQMENSNDSSEAQKIIHNVNQKTSLSKGKIAVDLVDVKIATDNSDTSSSNQVGEILTSILLIGLRMAELVIVWHKLVFVKILMQI